MVHFFVRISFVIGLILGIIIALICSAFQPKAVKRLTPIRTIPNRQLPFASIYENWFTKKDFHRSNASFDTLRYSNNRHSTEDQYLFKEVRILCTILIHNTKYAEAAERTWAKRCNDVLLVNLALPKTKIPVKKTKENAAWPILCKHLKTISHLFHWVLIVNDNTYALLENLRYMVAGLDHSKKYYLGHAMTFWGTLYNAGQAGYILSNGTLTALRKKLSALNFCTADSTFWNMEDYYLGKTLSSLNVSPLDTRDVQGLATFHGFNLQKLFFMGSTSLSNYYKFSFYPTKCCSSHSVTFQVEDSDRMFTYDYILYQLQVFREGSLGNIQASTPVPEEEVWRTYLREHGINASFVSADDYYKLWENDIVFTRDLMKMHRSY